MQRHDNPDKSLGSQTFAPTALTSESSVVSFKINGVPFSYNIWNYTLNEIMEDVNDSTAGVTMSYDADTDKVTLANKSTGAKTISLTDVKGNFLDVLNVLDVTRGNISSAADPGNTSDATISSTLKSNTAANDTYTITFGAGGTTYNVVRQSDAATIASNIAYTSGTANRLNIGRRCLSRSLMARARRRLGIFLRFTVSSNPNPAPNPAAYHAARTPRWIGMG